MNVRLSDRELATVLAALRFWQRALAENEDEAPVADHFVEDIRPLSCEEIDELCERLNTETGSA